MVEYELIEILKIFFLIVTVGSLVCAFIPYSRIHHGKSFQDFFLHFTSFYGPMSLKNTQDDHRKNFKKVTNVCMILFWLSLVGQFVLFVTR